MGFDVTWHPISQREIRRWYFDRLAESAAGNLSTINAILEEQKPGREAGYEEFCRKAYRDLLRQGAGIGPDEPFDKTHSYLLAMVQGLFRTYFYTRGGIFSGLVATDPDMAAYTVSFQTIVGDRFGGQMLSRISENYSGGVFIPESAIPRLLADYESGKIEAQLKLCFGGTLPVFLKALVYAKSHRLGLLEATEVVEPNPLNLEATVCRSYLMNCDQDGVLLYAETAKRQLAEAARQAGEAPDKVQAVRQVYQLHTAPPAPPEPEPPARTEQAEQEKAPPAKPVKKAEPKRKGFFGRLFGGK